MFDLHKALAEEANEEYEFEDERIASNLYLTSLSYSLRSLKEDSSQPESEREKKIEANMWLKNESIHILDIPAINFDCLKCRIDAARPSCDVFFYNAGFSMHHKHLIGEYKNTSKKEMVKMIASDGADGLKPKITSSIDLLRTEISFTTTEEEQRALEGDIHLFLVYGGKNDMSSSGEWEKRLPRSEHVSRDSRRKQMSASKQRYSNVESEKHVNAVFNSFGSFLIDKGLVPCTKEEFPGNALPKLSKSGIGKIRFFSMFSAADFTEIVDGGYFDAWNWGTLAPYLERMSGCG